MLTIEIHQENIPAIFRRFCEVVGDRAWLDPASRVDADIERNALLRDYLTEQNSLILAFRQCSIAAANNCNYLPWGFTEHPQLFEAHVFATQTLALIDTARQFSNKRANSLISRIQDALRYPQAVQALQLEARVATHFSISGQIVRFPELGSGRERFDILIESLGPDGLEIECKAITHDKGRKIHRNQVLEFYHSAKPLIQTVARDLTSGLAVVVNLPERMPQPADLEAYIQAITSQVLSAKSGLLQDGTLVHLIDFLPHELGELKLPLSKENKTGVERVTGTKNRECLIFQAEGKAGILILVLQSSQPDSMLHEVFATLAESAGRQLTGTRAGAFIGGFQGLGRTALLEIATNEGRDGVYSPLAFEASRFLERSEFPHVVGVGFLSSPDNKAPPNSELSQGVSYYFPKRTTSFWHPHFSGMFEKPPLASSA